MLVLEDRVVVSVHTDTIRKHLLLVIEKGIGAEILRKIHLLVHRRSSSIIGGASVPSNDAVFVATHVGHTLLLQKQWRYRETERQKRREALMFFFLGLGLCLLLLKVYVFNLKKVAMSAPRWHLRWSPHLLQKVDPAWN